MTKLLTLPAPDRKRPCVAETCGTRTAKVIRCMSGKQNRYIGSEQPLPTYDMAPAPFFAGCLTRVIMVTFYLIVMRLSTSFSHFFEIQQIAQKGGIIFVLGTLL